MEIELAIWREMISANYENDVRIFVGWGMNMNRTIGTIFRQGFWVSGWIIGNLFLLRMDLIIFIKKTGSTNRNAVG